MNILLVLLLILVAARLGGEVAIRLQQSPMLGEIVAGLVLGPTLLGVIDRGPSVDLLSHLGILFLMFLAGLEADLRLIKKVAGASTAISIGGVVVSFAGGYGAGLAFGLSSTASLFLGAALSSSSIVVTARVLSDFGLMRSELGFLSMATNAVDDVNGMFVLLIVVSAVGKGTGRPIWMQVGELVLYAVVATLVGLYLFRPLMSLIDRAQVDEIYFSVAIALVLLYSWAANAMGLADVLGAFIAGAFLHYTEEAEPSMITRVEAISDGFLVPVFFAAMGLETNLRDLGSHLPLLGVVLMVAIASKMVGCGLPARLLGYDWRRAYVIGAGMVPRAEMTLVLLGIGMSTHVLPNFMAPLLVSIVVLTALATGPLLRLGLREHQQAGPGSPPTTRRSESGSSARIPA